MATKTQLTEINNAAIQENRSHTIAPAVIDALPDDDTNYVPTGLLAGPMGTWEYTFDLPGTGSVELTVTNAERAHHGI